MFTEREIVVLGAAIAACGSIIWGKNLTPESAQHWLESMGIEEAEVGAVCDKVLHVERVKEEVHG